MVEKKQVKIKDFYYAVGRRKSAIAQVRLTDKGKGEIIVNKKPLNEYLGDVQLQKTIMAPMQLTNLSTKLNVSVIVKGGGKRGQAEAIRHGIARAIEKMDGELRKALKVAGYLKRDARIKERKKPGLKRARRAPQWAKR